MNKIHLRLPGFTFLDSCSLANTKYEAKKKALIAAFDRGNMVHEKGESKIDDYVKALYRTNVNIENDEEIVFYLHLALIETLDQPELIIGENSVTLAFSDYKGKEFPNKFLLPANYSNRGFINTSDSSFIAQNVAYSLDGLSSHSLGLTTQTFSAVDGSNSKKYRHFNLTFNHTSVTLHIINQTNWSHVITTTLARILGDEYVDKMLTAIREESNVKDVDGLSKQINMPVADGYLSISPVFNHHVMTVMNKLRYTKNKVANLNTKQLGGTKPGNISYTALLEGGEMTSFTMEMPVVTDAFKQKQFLLVKKGMLDLRDSISPIKQYIMMMEKQDVNDLLRRLLNNICYYLVINALTQISRIEESDVADMHESILILIDSAESKQKQASKGERAEALMNLIISNLRVNKGIDHQHLMTPEFNKRLREKVIQNV